ncbi:hypothetical protein ABFX02_14G024400 [Erythranthe guttata]
MATNDEKYPLEPNCYKIIEEIGRGVSAIVYKALCITMDSAVVAIKAIDLERSGGNFDNFRLEAKTMTLLCHPNILKAHCSFTVGTRLWVVMPFISGGSLQSIISSSFRNGLSEPLIATVLKEILTALSYLHGQGHLHRDIKAGNILIDSNGAVKLADFGVSASIYESNWSTRSMMLTDVAGTPYWMAPEVVHSHTGYSFKADIWSFGITALELAHGRPPLSHLPPSKSLIVKITKRFRFSDHYQKSKDDKGKERKFSKSFKNMVSLCLDQDPSKRPSSEKLLRHSFFKNCRSTDFLVKNLLQGLPCVGQRFRGGKIQRVLSFNRSDVLLDVDFDEKDGFFSGENTKQRRISGWNFNEEGFKMDPVFPCEQKEEEGESIIQENGNEGLVAVGSDSSPEQTEGSDEKGRNIDDGYYGNEAESGSGVNMGVVVESLMFLEKSLEYQKEQVGEMIAWIRGEETVEKNREDELMEVITKLRMEIEREKKKRFDLEMELQSLKLQICSE